VATGNLQSCPAAALPSARSVKDDYLKLTKLIVKQVEAKKIERPNLEHLGVLREKVRDEGEWQLQDGNEEINLL
jgi:hypothetical protein